MGFSRRAAAASAFVVVILACVACSGKPSKRAIMDAVGRDAKMPALCTLPIDILSQLRMQYTTKGVCVAKHEPSTPKVQACMDALAAAKKTALKPVSYMREWPDDVAARSLSDVPAYERKARDLVYATCFELSDERLRQGQFVCGQATYGDVEDVTLIDDEHADVKLGLKLALDEDLPTVTSACPSTVLPPANTTVRLEKTSKGWALAPPAGSTTPSGAR